MLFMRVLDLGCGSGRDLAFWDVTPSDKVIGLDMDEERLSIARVRFPSRAYVRGVSQCLPFRDQSFDRVISEAALPYMNIQKTLLEIYRILVVNGILSLRLHSPRFTIAELCHNALPRPIPSLFRLYVMANGVLFHWTGRTCRFVNGKNESFQTRRGMGIALRRTGFNVLTYTPTANRTFILEARKAQVTL
jgi:ubiquinone/menaquinone biosynthesis C-methylase UbiE